MSEVKGSWKDITDARLKEIDQGDQPTLQEAMAIETFHRVYYGSLRKRIRGIPEYYVSKLSELENFVDEQNYEAIYELFYENQLLVADNKLYFQSKNLLKGKVPKKYEEKIADMLLRGEDDTFLNIALLLLPLPKKITDFDNYRKDRRDYVMLGVEGQSTYFYYGFRVVDVLNSLISVEDKNMLLKEYLEREETFKENLNKKIAEGPEITCEDDFIMLKEDLKERPSSKGDFIYGKSYIEGKKNDCTYIIVYSVDLDRLFKRYNEILQVNGLDKELLKKVEENRQYYKNIYDRYLDQSKKNNSEEK